MQTVDKALNLLKFFSADRPDIGLSELARLSGLDKAATRRFLVALQKHDFIDQDPASRKYRLGAGFLHLARVREATSPVTALVTPHLQTLMTETGETAHASLLSALRLTTIGVATPNRTTRVHVDPAEPLPIHATASGLACLAYSPPDLLDRVTGEELKAHTDRTIRDPDALIRAVRKTRKNGFAVGEQSFESEVVGIAVPFFDAAGVAEGAIAVAGLASRMDEALRDRIIGLLVASAIAVTSGLGGHAPAEFLKANAVREAA